MVQCVQICNYECMCKRNFIFFYFLKSDFKALSGLKFNLRHHRASYPLPEGYTKVLGRNISGALSLWFILAFPELPVISMHVVPRG